MLVDWWNDQVAWIEEQAATKERGHFRWSQLVWQELRMWTVMLCEQVTDKDFEFICDRRGFDKTEQAFIIRGLQHMGFADALTISTES